MIKYFFFFISIFSTCTLSAETYYISNEGNDNNNGTMPEQAWQSIDKCNSVDLKAGDSILFKRNEIFTGTLKIRNSGSDSLNIYIGAYGVGDKPILKGSKTISGFKQQEENIYAVEETNHIKHLILNERLLTIARYPNAGFLTMQGGGRQYLVFDEIPFSAQTMEGATVRMRTINWQFEYRTITKIKENEIHFDSVLFYNTHTQRKCQKGWGYYIDNKKEFLDENDEWFYDMSNQTLYLYTDNFAESPDLNGIFLDYGVLITKGNSNISIHDIHIMNYNENGISAEGNNNNISINNCYFNNIIKTAIYFGTNSHYNNVVNNTIKDVYGRAISMLETSHANIKNNKITHIGLKQGYGTDGVNGATGILITSREIEGENFIVSNNNYIGYNVIDSIGYVNIRMDGNNSVCEFNLVSNGLLTLNDGSLIYCWGKDSTFTQNNIINNNILYNAVGNVEGAVNDHKMNNGIYLDNNSNNITVKNNIVQRTNNGIIVNDGSYDNEIFNNILYGNYKAALSFAEWNEFRLPAVNQNNVAYNNILFNTYNLKHSLTFLHTYKPEFDPVDLDSNIYASPNEKYHIKFSTVDDGCKTTKEYDFKSWQENSGEDKNSTFIEIPKAYSYDIYVNKKDTAVSRSLNPKNQYYNLKFKKIDNTIELSPYSAKILLHKLKGQ